MKGFKFVMVSLALFAALICALALSARADDQQAVSDLERKLAAVTNANEAMKYFGSGNDIVLFDVMGPPREFVGHKAIHDHLMGV